MLFQARQDVLKPLTTVAFGDRVQLEVPREFFLEYLLIHIRVTNGGTAYTQNVAGDGLAGILDNVRLTVATGANTRSPINCGSAALIQFARQWNGGVDRNTIFYADPTLNTAPAANQIRDLYIPIFFAPPNLDDPVASAFLLPMPRYSSNPILEFTVAPATYVSSANNPTLQYRVIMGRRFVDIPNWVTYDTELVETRVPYAAAGTQLPWELPAPGAYTGILMSAYTSATPPVARGYDTLSGTRASGNDCNPWELKFLGTTLRRLSLMDLLVLNDYSAEVFAGTSPHNGTFGYHHQFFDFLSDQVGATASNFNSVLDTTPLVAQGARVNLLANIANAGDVIRFTHHRVYGDISALRQGIK